MQAIYALTIVLAIYAAGDLISYFSKARVPAAIAWAVIILAGLWTGILPSYTFEDSTISGFGMMAVTLMIVMLGTTIDTPELKRQIKTIIVCVAGVLLSTVLILVIGPHIINPQYAYVGSAVYAGGNAVILMMTSVLKPEGLTDVVGFFTILGTAQGFFGQPLCSYFLRRYAKRFLADPDNIARYASDENKENSGTHRRRPLQLPEKMDRIPVILMKVALVASLAAYLSGLTGGRIHAFVISIILGWICVETGFLKKGTMNSIESAGIITFLAACVLFGNYVGITPQMFLGYIIPIVVVMLLGIAGTAIAGIVIGKLCNMPVDLAIALGLTCTFGFPLTMIMTDNVCDAMARSKEEHTALYNVLLPKMLVAGFVTVTIVSVFIGSFVLAKFF